MLPFFDAHLHIIDPQFPLVPNQGYTPDAFTVSDYRARTEHCAIVGGAVVSGSFQAFDQAYLRAALAELGPTFVGVTQLPASVTDETLCDLHQAGVRAIRFNLKRGGSAELQDLDRLARRVHEVVGWHSELYVDARELPDIAPVLTALPAVSIDHLGLSQAGLPSLLRLAEAGVRVKATGFGRGDLKVARVLSDLYAANPGCLLFGTDLPCTRAPRPYCDDDWRLIEDTLGDEGAKRVGYENAFAFYRLPEG